MEENSKPFRGRLTAKTPVFETEKEGSTPSPGATKFHTYCEQDLDLSLFNKKGMNKNGTIKLQPWCRSCQSVYFKNRYKTDGGKLKESAISRNKRRKAKNQKELFEILKSGCVDCGNTDVRVLEFDHLRDKVKGIGLMLNDTYSMETIKKEIEKCDIVCANCHRIRTQERSGSWRIELMGLEQDGNASDF